MARPARISTESILDAARAAFLEKGISVTTAEVARRAGVAEGTLFKRFKNKEELFVAAMLARIEEPAWFRSALSRVGQGEVRQNLLELGAEIIDFFRSVLPLLMMHWSNAGSLSLPWPLALPNPPPLRGLKRLTEFFAAEGRAGRLALREPEVMARVFLGSLQNFVFFELLFKAQAIPLPSEQAYLRDLVEVLWSGIAPAHDPGRPRAGTGRVAGGRPARGKRASSKRVQSRKVSG